MTTVRDCVGLLSCSVRLPGRSCAQPLVVPRILRTPQIAVRSRSRGHLSSANYCAAPAVSHPLRSNADPVFRLRCGENSPRQWPASTSPHSSGPVSSLGAAAVSSFYHGSCGLTRRSMATSQSAASVSLAPTPSSSLEREKPVAVGVSAAADSPAVIHQSITSEQQLLARMNALKTYLLAANWQDYLSFVMNSAFWEAEMRLLEVEARPFTNTSSKVEGLLRDLRRLFDLMAQASDVRDHINQILELGSRATGLAGTGLNAADKVENFEDHVQAAVAEYDRLMKEYPEYCSLVDDCLGSGLAMMRQKQRFTFSALHRYFY